MRQTIWFVFFFYQNQVIVSFCDFRPSMAEESLSSKSFYMHNEISISERRRLRVSALFKMLIVVY